MAENALSEVVFTEVRNPSPTPLRVAVVYGGALDGATCMATAYIPGIDADALLGQPRPSWALVAYVGQRVAQALAHLHGQGLLHKRLTSRRVRLGFRGDCIVTGLRQELKPPDDYDGPLLFWPTKHEVVFLSPEQIRQTPLTPRSDLYALGVLLWQLSTGKVLFSGTHIPEILFQAMTAPVPRLLEVEPTAPPELATLVHRLLEKEAANRPEAASEVASALGAIATGLAPHPGASYGPLELIKELRGRFPARYITEMESLA